MSRRVGGSARGSGAHEHEHAAQLAERFAAAVLDGAQDAAGAVGVRREHFGGRARGEAPGFHVLGRDRSSSSATARMWASRSETSSRTAGDSRAARRVITANVS
jgi:hypothetical protein